MPKPYLIEVIQRFKCFWFMFFHFILSASYRIVRTLLNQIPKKELMFVMEDLFNRSVHLLFYARYWIVHLWNSYRGFRYFTRIDHHLQLLFLFYYLIHYIYTPLLYHLKIFLKAVKKFHIRFFFHLWVKTIWTIEIF